MADKSSGLFIIHDSVFDVYIPIEWLYVYTVEIQYFMTFWPFKWIIDCEKLQSEITTP